MSRTPNPPTEYASHPELAIASLLFMLTRVHATGCHAMAASIAAHFRFVANDPRMPEIVRNAAQRLGMEWQARLDAADHDGSVH